MTLQQSTERFFNDLHNLLDNLLDSKVAIFSIEKNIKKLETQYPEFQVIIGLKKIQFYTFTPQEQFCILLLVHNVYLQGI